MRIIQEPWYREDSFRVLKIPGYALYSAGGTDKPKASILVWDMTTWTLPGFSSRELVAVLVKYSEDGADRRLVVCYTYLPYDRTA
jgi:hypothetical protein